MVIIIVNHHSFPVSQLPTRSNNEYFEHFPKHWLEQHFGVIETICSISTLLVTEPSPQAAVIVKMMGAHVFFFISQAPLLPGLYDTPSTPSGGHRRETHHQPSDKIKQVSRGVKGPLRKQLYLCNFGHQLEQSCLSLLKPWGQINHSWSLTTAFDLWSLLKRLHFLGLTHPRFLACFTEFSLSCLELCTLWDATAQMHCGSLKTSCWPGL